MLETTAPIAVFRTGQGIVPHPKVGRCGRGWGEAAACAEPCVGAAGWAGWPQQDGGHHGGGGGGYHGVGGGGGVGARDPRAYIYGFWF